MIKSSIKYSLFNINCTLRMQIFNETDNDCYYCYRHGFLLEMMSETFCLKIYHDESLFRSISINVCKKVSIRTEKI